MHIFRELNLLIGIHDLDVHSWVKIGNTVLDWMTTQIHTLAPVEVWVSTANVLVHRIAFETFDATYTHSFNCRFVSLMTGSSSSHRDENERSTTELIPISFTRVILAHMVASRMFCMHRILAYWPASPTCDGGIAIIVQITINLLIDDSTRNSGMYYIC